MSLLVNYMFTTSHNNLSSSAVNAWLAFGRFPLPCSRSDRAFPSRTLLQF